MGTLVAHPLLVLEDDITTDHISPAEAIPASSDVGKWLVERGENPRDLNVYASYRRNGAERYRTMTLPTDELIRRFLLHVLPRGFHRIRHYGLLASGTRRDNLARARELLAMPPPAPEPDTEEPTDHRPPCPCCGGRMLILETFERCAQPRAPPRPTCSPGRTAS